MKKHDFSQWRMWEQLPQPFSMYIDYCNLPLDIVVDQKIQVKLTIRERLAGTTTFEGPQAVAESDP